MRNMSLVRRVEENRKNVVLVGISHRETYHDKGLGKLFKDVDIIALEGCYDTPYLTWRTILDFVGEEGWEIAKEKSIPFTPIDPIVCTINYISDEIKNIFCLLKIKEEMKFSWKFTIFLRRFLKALKRSKLLWELYSRRMRDLALNFYKYYNELYPEYFPLRDVGMAHAVRKLEDSYGRVLVVTGSFHVPFIEELLKREDLDKLYQENKVYFERKRLDIYDPKNLEIIDTIKL